MRRSRNLPYQILAFIVLIQCYRQFGKRPDKVKPLESEKVQINQSIFFIETDNSLTEIRGKTLCAMESAAIVNPSWSIILLIDADSEIRDLPTHFLRHFGNLLVRRVDFGELVKSTPAESLWKSGVVTGTKFRLSNISNVLRFVLMLKFGGMYLDQDALCLKKVPETEGNFLVASGPSKVGSAMIRFEKGHQFLGDTLQRMTETFNGNVWGRNGADLVTSSLYSFCNGTRRRILRYGDQLAGLDCQALRILSPEMGNPVHWSEYTMLFEPNSLKKVLDKIKDSYFLHYNNFMKTGHVTLGQNDLGLTSEQPLYKVMARQCPVTERHFLRREATGHQ